MLGWYVDVGHCDSVPKNLNQISFLDINRPYGIITSSIFNDFSIDTPDPQIAYENEFSIIGNDVNTFFSIPRGGFAIVAPEENYVSALISAFPSINKSFPNLHNYYMSNKVGWYCCVLFRSLNRLLVCSTSTNENGTIFRVNGDSLEAIATIKMGYWPFCNCSMSRYSSSENNNFNCTSIIAEEWDDYSLLDFTKYHGRTSISYFTSTKYKTSMQIFTTPVQLINILNAMFTEESKPDFTVVKPDNPYEPGGPSEPGGGGGSFDNDSDPIPDSSLPSISSANTGFTRIYNPTLSQVQDLARYLWTDDSVIETIWNHIKQFFENPMEAIIAFNLVPVVVPNGGTKNFALMYIDTGVQMTVADNQFVDVDCGTLEVKEYYGSALDYSPNTKISCFLPFIGTVSLNTDEVMNTTLQVKYRVDICSGSCVAKILVNGNVLYQYSGHCAIPIPLSAADFSSYVTAAISVGKLVGTALAAGAGVAAAAGAEDASQQTNQIVTTTQITNTTRNPATGRQITTGTQTRVETREAPADQSSTQASFNGLSAQNIANTVGQVMSSKPHIEHSGGFSGNSGYLGIRRPFIIIERPNMCMPANFQSLNGFPSMLTLELSSCKGFTRVQQVQLTGLSATNPEQAEILQLLKSGVIL